MLVTHGIYRFCRHPSYLGWWLFAVGTQVLWSSRGCMWIINVFLQVLLHNPFCTLGFFYGAYRFFVARVPFEEETLVEFFGDEYITYRRSVPLLLPFIRDSAKDDWCHHNFQTPDCIFLVMRTCSGMDCVQLLALFLVRNCEIWFIWWEWFCEI